MTLYLLSSSNLKLRPMLTRQLKPGARIVSHAFGMGDWEPEKIDDFKDANGSTRRLYLWRADGTVRGSGPPARAGRARHGAAAGAVAGPYVASRLAACGLGRARAEFAVDVEQRRRDRP